jgi:alanine dehydrogenase
MAVEVLTQAGHKVLVQTTAGEGSGFSDKEYIQAGATMVKTAEEVWKQAEMIYHVKEPIPSEYQFFRKGLVIFTYLHLAAEKELTLKLAEKGVTAIAFETVEAPDGTTPLLDPMSAIAGRIAILVGAQYLGRMYKGAGMLLGGVPGVAPAIVVVLGGGVVGTNAAQMALGLGARVIMVTRNLARLRYLEEVLHGRFETLASNPYNIARAVKEADVVVGAVLVKGARAPIMVTREMVKSMKPGSVIVDVAVDQAGCIETTRPTTHKDPIYTVDDVIHYCVTNMPGMFPRTSAIALSNATLPYALRLANLGFREALKSDPGFKLGLNVYDGKIVNKAVAESLALEYTPYKT